MSWTCGETVEQQAYLTRFLLDYTAASLVGGTFLRGVLPTRDAVRVVTGTGDAMAPDALVVYEVPLMDDDDEPVTAPLVLGWARTLAAGDPPHPDASVMGMALVRVNTSAVEPAPPTSTDRVLRVLRTLAWPSTETPPSPPLCGFLLDQEDGMRLYIAVEEANGLIAVDVRLTGALTALLAALPTLVHEKERWTPDTDPHCTHAIDLTAW
ncbi:hypothetical protein ACF08M_04780 [Streptomyces sp. NPDC015032]|uniref:hypothetical protein n=1 Tax=Streptomyces sp. NPDC015032 TaxID=3364937 RepID=UPI0036F96205